MSIRFARPQQVLSYLGRYTHRVVISNNRILQIDHKQVTFTWRDYHQDNKMIITSLIGSDFMKRFSLHILPPGFTRIRYLVQITANGNLYVAWQSAVAFLSTYPLILERCRLLRFALKTALIIYILSAKVTDCSCHL